MLRPAQVCGALLAALEAAEGRRRSRKRDQTPDGIGLTIKRELLHRAVQENPNPEAFEEWLLHTALACAPQSSGAVTAMARAIYDEWKLAHSMNEFKMCLNQGPRWREELAHGQSQGRACNDDVVVAAPLPTKRME